MKATNQQIREQANGIAQQAEGLGASLDADQSAHARALLILEQAKTLVAWTEATSDSRCEADLVMGNGDVLCGEQGAALCASHGCDARTCYCEAPTHQGS